MYTYYAPRHNEWTQRRNLSTFRLQCVFVCVSFFTTVFVKRIFYLFFKSGSLKGKSSILSFPMVFFLFSFFHFFFSLVYVPCIFSYICVHACINFCWSVKIYIFLCSFSKKASFCPLTLWHITAVYSFVSVSKIQLDSLSLLIYVIVCFSFCPCLCL